MRILFSATRSKKISRFESLLRALLAHGHEVRLVFMMHGDQGSADGLVAALARDHPGLTVVQLGKRSRAPHAADVDTLRAFGDYIRYVVPPLDAAPMLRRRAGDRLSPRMIHTADRFLQGRIGRVRQVTRAIAAAENGMPRDPRIDVLLREYRPDVLLVTPYVDLVSSQSDYVRSARAFGIPSGLCVHSWDNLSNKGRIRIPPDMVLVWNAAQKEEAVRLHGIDPATVRVTGAHSFDHWFSAVPSTTYDEFCRTTGLDSRYPVVAYLCSSAQIAPKEVEFVRRWIGALRASHAPSLRDAGVLIRPHPYNSAQWEDADFSQDANVAVWPRGGQYPIDASAKGDYFDSLFHSTAVVGVNTSGLIEAGILGRPVFTIKDPLFAESQDGTFHFHHLVKADEELLQVAHGFAEHIGQIEPFLSRDSRAGVSVAHKRFMETFVRPWGLYEPGTPRMVAAIHELATWKRPASSPSVGSRAMARATIAIGDVARWWEAKRQRQGQRLESGTRSRPNPARSALKSKKRTKREAQSQ